MAHSLADLVAFKFFNTHSLTSVWMYFPVLIAFELNWLFMSIGPYDEIMFIPGEFNNPVSTKHMRITTIYVSTEASIRNGRRNWGGRSTPYLKRNNSMI
jgi:hypothetical protein